MIDNSQPPTADNAPLNHKRSILALMVSTLGICLAIFAYFLYQKYWPATDDAYIQAHVVNVAAQVSGPIAHIYVHNNDTVHAQQLLFEIDRRPFKAELAEAKANFTLAMQQMEAEIAAVDVAAATVDKFKAQLEVDEKNYNRTIALVKTGQASIASGDNASGQLQASRAALIAAQHQLIQAQKNLGGVGENNAQVQQARAALKKAALNLSYTRIYAPAEGYITNFEMRVGSMVSAQQTLFQLVENTRWWVYANYKETQMARIHSGQPVTVNIDMYPGQHFKGHVDSISRGSGAAFSLLPPENATGNWVKVTQRFPIKIILETHDARYPLRVGASCDVTINTLIHSK